MTVAATAVHLLISGDVQGVGFRDATQAQAERLGLSGWVRNLADGRVELVARGPSHAVARLTAWCRNGPPAARVEGVSTESWPPPSREGFLVVRGQGSSVAMRGWEP